MTDTTDMTILLTLDEYAAQAGKSDRTIRRWCEADELPGAVNPGGGWLIPATAVRVEKPKSAVTRQGHVNVSEERIAAVLEQLTHQLSVLQLGALRAATQAAPVGELLTIAEAAERLGTTKIGVRKLGAAGSIDLGKYGPRGALRVYFPPMNP